MGSERVTAIAIPLNEFERSLMSINEDRAKFSQPFAIGVQEKEITIQKKSR